MKKTRVKENKKKEKGGIGNSHKQENMIEKKKKTMEVKR